MRMRRVVDRNNALLMGWKCMRRHLLEMKNTIICNKRVEEQRWKGNQCVLAEVSMVSYSCLQFLAKYEKFC